MRERLEHRLKALKAELEAGEKMIAELDARRANLRDTLLRISGAIQVLEEEFANADQATSPGPDRPDEVGAEVPHGSERSGEHAQQGSQISSGLQ